MIRNHARFRRSVTNHGRYTCHTLRTFKYNINVFSYWFNSSPLTVYKLEKMKKGNRLISECHVETNSQVRHLWLQQQWKTKEQRTKSSSAVRDGGKKLYSKPLSSPHYVSECVCVCVCEWILHSPPSKSITVFHCSTIHFWSPFLHPTTKQMKG